MCHVIFLFLLKHLYIHSRTLFECGRYLRFLGNFDWQTVQNWSWRLVQHSDSAQVTDGKAFAAAIICIVRINVRGDCLFVCIFYADVLNWAAECGPLSYDTNSVNSSTKYTLCCNQNAFLSVAVLEFKKCAFNQVEKGTADTNLILLSSCSRKTRPAAVGMTWENGPFYDSSDSSVLYVVCAVCLIR